MTVTLLDQALAAVEMSPYPKNRLPGNTMDIDELMARVRVPGVSISLIADGDIGPARHVGFRDSRNGEAISSDTLFQAGSISKSVTAICALRLAADGCLDLDSDVKRMLTSWELRYPLRWNPRVSVRQLLSHTAGLTVHGFPGYHRDSTRPTLIQILEGEAPANTPPIRIRIAPGTQFSYSGGGYCVLQQLLVDVTGTAFPDLVEALVFGPLSLTRTTFEQPLPEPRWQVAASGHRTAGDPVDGAWHVYPEMAAAGLWTTAEELALIFASIQQSAMGSREGLLPAWLAREALRPHAANASYGLGLRLQDSRAAAWFGHAGDDQGFVAKALASVDGNAGLVVMTNSDEGGKVIESVVAAVAQVLEWPYEAVRPPSDNCDACAH